MTQAEIKDKYTMLYDYMATSQKPEYMKAFGHAMNEMMDWFIINKPEAAQEWVEQLCAIKWHNYLTTKEAEAIVSKMNPKAPWSRDVWNKAMDSFGIPTEESPYYNSCALWVVMNMVYSDSAQTIAKLMEASLAEIPQQQLVKAVHAFALDKLKDTDGVFNVRKYFGLQ
jgi:hypothetical protein